MTYGYRIDQSVIHWNHTGQRNKVHVKFAQYLTPFDLKLTKIIKIPPSKQNPKNRKIGPKK